MYVERDLRKYFFVGPNNISLYGGTIANNIKVYLKGRLL